MSKRKRKNIKEKESGSSSSIPPKEKSWNFFKDNYFVFAISISMIVFIVYSYSKNITSFDSRWSIHTSLSIIHEGNTDLNEYSEIVKKHNNYAIEDIDGNIYTIFPIGVSLFSSPIVFLLEKIQKNEVDLVEYARNGIPAGLEKFIASIWMALASLFIYLIGFSVTKDPKSSIFSMLVFAFCTSAWSTASRGLWQHGPSMLMLSISLYLLLLSKNKPKIAQFVSIPLAFSYVIRPTNSISILFLSLYVLVEYREYFVRYILWSLLISIPFIVFNFNVYDFFLPPYYMPNRIFSGSRFLEALAGNLVSPARGIFIFSPVLLFSIYGVYVKMKSKTFLSLDFSIVAIVIGHYVVISSFPHWWGGHSFGPRLMSDMLPYFMYFFATFVASIPPMTAGIQKSAISILFVLTAAFSFFVHYRGATQWDVYVWNSLPVNVEKAPERLWDWKDVQFLRGIGGKENLR